VPIVEVPVVVPRIGEEEEEEKKGEEEEGDKEGEEEVEIEMGIKIAVVVFEEKKRKSSVQTRMEGLRKMKMERLYGVGKVLGEEETEDDLTPTPTVKTKNRIETGSPVSKIAGSRHCPPVSASGTGTSVSSTAAKPRMRVLIETTGTLGHYKCLVAKLCGMAERVIGGLLEGDEDMVRACEEVKKNRGQKANADMGKRPVWNVEASGEWC